ncbi:hypothetical protein Tco_0715817 [Tanacetum coccineum]
MPVQTRRQLATDPEMCMFALTVSIVEPKNIKEAMADSAWIEAMQDELHQFDRLKNKKDEDQTVIRNKARLVAKGYAQEEGIDSSSKSLTLIIAGCLESRGKSTSGGIQFLGDTLVCWMSIEQNCTAMSSAVGRVCGVICKFSCASNVDEDNIIQDYGFNYNKIPVDATSVSHIKSHANPLKHSRTSTFHTRYLLIRNRLENGIIELYFVRRNTNFLICLRQAIPEGSVLSICQIGNWYELFDSSRNWRF